MAQADVRELVVDSLISIYKEKTFLSVVEKAVLDKYDYYDPRDKAFYKRVLSGTVERKIRIDYILGLFSNTKINKMKPVIYAVLSSSIYQIMWMDSVPDSAVCNEAVKIIEKRGLKGLKGFVNGVLRNICRNKTSIKYPDRTKELTKYLSCIYSCPEWIVDKLRDEIGDEITESMLEASMNEGPVTVRIRDAENIDNLVNEWTKAGVQVRKCAGIKGAYDLGSVYGVTSLAGYDEGKFTVQNIGSMYVAHLAQIKPGDCIMDVCAAPGGKSIHAADILRHLENKDYSGERGHVYSYDISEDKCDKIRENVDRLNVGNITIKAHDATVFMTDMTGKADVVIVDAPCSGLGVIGHKSDIKYRLLKEDIGSLSKLQRQIIDNAVNYVKPGGILVYSTCTVSKAENTDQKDYILEKYPFSIQKIDQKEDLQLIPGQNNSDGFYIAVFKKDING